MAVGLHNDVLIKKIYCACSTLKCTKKPGFFDYANTNKPRVNLKQKRSCIRLKTLNLNANMNKPRVNLKQKRSCIRLKTLNLNANTNKPRVKDGVVTF